MQLQSLLFPNERLVQRVIHNLKYSKHLSDLNRRETLEETINRNVKMHVDKWPHLSDVIQDAFEGVYLNELLPSMRNFQFAGPALLRNHARGYNCSYTPVDHPTVFREILFLLLSGSGVGYSVQRHHIAMLPAIMKPRGDMRYLIGDSIEGWSDAVSALIKAYLQGKPRPRFDYSDIRPKGAPLKTSGGRAPGPAKLKHSLEKVEEILRSKKEGSKLLPIECHDIICHVADAVISGGIRRSALISLFSCDDLDMLNAKKGKWWEENPQRGRANNSSVAPRQSFGEREFWNLWGKISDSRSGDPGIVWSYHPDSGYNPCVEAALDPNTFCNLVEINAAIIQDQSQLNRVARAASIIATLQSAYTDFHYLRQIWKDSTERDALIGVSMTGIVGGNVLNLNLREAAKVVRDANAEMAKALGINKAARTTMVKPAGTTSLLMGGVSNGIHAYHNDYYFKRITINHQEPIYNYLMNTIPAAMEPSQEPGKENLESFLVMPMKAPEGAITRSEGPLSQLERIRSVYRDWIVPGHRRGANTNNISSTVSVKSNQWDDVGHWLWENKHDYQAMAVFPDPDEGGLEHVAQLPLQDVTKEQYEAQMAILKDLDLTQITEEEDSTNLQGEVACAGGACAL